MAEAEKAAGLEKLPEALAKRTAVVTLSGGRTVVVHKWSVMKARELVVHVDNLERLAFMAEQSVDPKDRELVLKLEDEDLTLIVAAAVELNMGLLKNLHRLGKAIQGLNGAMESR